MVQNGLISFSSSSTPYKVANVVAMFPAAKSRCIGVVLCHDKVASRRLRFCTSRHDKAHQVLDTGGVHEPVPNLTGIGPILHAKLAPHFQ